MDNLEFVELGGRLRPITFNFNVQSDLEQYQNIDKKQEKVERLIDEKLEETGKDELSTEEIEEITEQVGLSEVASNTRLMVFLMLKEGHRKANQDFTTTEVKIRPDEDGNPVKEKVGTRKITKEDVGEWVGEASETALETVTEVFENFRASQEQKDQMEKHNDRGEDNDEGKKS